MSGRGVDRPSLALEALLTPLACIYSGVAKIRNQAFDRAWKPAIDLGVPVVSIGNLTAGGTGKTPVTAMLTEAFRAQGKKVGIVSRGYGGREKGPLRVPASGGAEVARRFGDEPSWLAARFPEVPVFIGADRVSAVAALKSANDVELIIADDAFQHRRLARKFDIVILDALEPEWHYRPLPLGRMREGFSSLSRANAIFITKTNLAPRSHIERLRAWIKATVGNPVVIEVESVLAGFTKLGEEALMAPLSAGSLENARVLLASGIGRPESFERLMSEQAKALVVEHLIFSDHHQYGSADLERIANRARELKVSALVVTEKDAVKMTGWNPGVPCWVTKLEARGSMEGVYAALDRRLF